MAKKKKRKYFIGIDLGGTKMLTGLLDKKFRLISTLKTKVQVDKGEKYFFGAIVDSVLQVLNGAKVGLESVAAIGVGCPGIIDVKEGVVVSSPNISFLNNLSLGKKLSKYFDVPVTLENDVNVGLYGEFHFGAARGYSHVIGIFLGTGIGGALILNGKLYQGSMGAAGEIGHTLVDPLGPVCGCGNRGCLETEIGRPAIAAEAAMLALKNRAPKLLKMSGTDISKIKSGALAAAIKAGDAAIKTLVKNKAKLLGMAMANIVNVLNPEIIVLGGGVVEAMGKIIIPEADESMRHYAMSGLVKNVKVVAAKLKDYSIVMGAAKLAQEECDA
ncbi:MAG: ROK family protein [Candidatus Omnitrophica bacterium]|nr:ROK family protein [Candidatus Omnitrophota bacterium]